MFDGKINLMERFILVVYYDILKRCIFCFFKVKFINFLSVVCYFVFGGINVKMLFFLFFEVCLLYELICVLRFLVG